VHFLFNRQQCSTRTRFLADSSTVMPWSVLEGRCKLVVVTRTVGGRSLTHVSRRWVSRSYHLGAVKLVPESTMQLAWGSCIATLHHLALSLRSTVATACDACCPCTQCKKLGRSPTTLTRHVCTYKCQTLRRNTQRTRAPTSTRTHSHASKHAQIE